ncbi:FecR domain-containing protein [Crateriforma spongiae]|uniref:FecR domain-containing protein n=1 Tax=Crateriforma spongiae TaxID=2724528 RepID=UPI0014460311|nr:FecR domain-containing protein [Crateriforma spongiae]
MNRHDSSSPMSYEDFLRAATMFQDGAMSPEELEQFDKSLQRSPELRRWFIEFQEQSATLVECFRGQAVHGNDRIDTDTHSFSSRPQRTRIEPGTGHDTSSLTPGSQRTLAWAAVAMALAACVLVAFLPGKSSRQIPEHDAVMTFAEQASWGGAADQWPVDGRYLTRSDSYRLDSGSIRLRLNSGAIVSVAAPASFRIVGPESIDLLAGKMTARTSGNRTDLVIRAGDLEIRDSETAFGVTATTDGDVDLAVFDGDVSVRVTDDVDPPSEQMVVEGCALASYRSAGRTTEIPYEPGKYQDIWPLALGIDEASSIVDFVPPGPDVSLSSLAHNHKMFLVPEKLNHHVSRPADLKLVLPGQTWPSSPTQKFRVTPKQSVSSYLLMYKPQTSNFGSRQTLSGSISFQHPILGIAVTGDQLRNSDQPFGIDDLDYKAFRGRHLEDVDTEFGSLPADSITISDDGRQLYFSLHVGALTDHLRVLVDDSQSTSSTDP